MADLRIPVSPIHGMVNTIGAATANTGPLAQLANPAGSGVNLHVYELNIGITQGTGTDRTRVRHTASPLTLAATVTTATLQRRDETDLTAILATLKASTATVITAFTEAVSFWYDRVNADANNTFEEFMLLRPLSFPVIVAPGSAIEATLPNNAANNAIRIYTCHDEIAA